MLIGRDMSHHNGVSDVNAGEFTILKVTEGQSWKDPKAKEYVQQLNKQQMIGAYHFLRADVKGNHPYKEAENFVNTLLELNLLYKAVLVCDYEGGSLGHEDYLLKFLEGVYIMTGVKPILYTGSAATKPLKRVATAGYELWLAHYGVSSPKFYNWKSCLMWQFTSTPFDINIFNGDESDWYRRTQKSN